MRPALSLAFGAFFAQDGMAASQYSHCQISSKAAHCVSNATNASATPHETTMPNLIATGKIGLAVVLICGACIPSFIFIVSSALYKNRLMKPWMPDNQNTAYSLCLRVSRGCSLINKTIFESGLFNLDSILVAHIKAAAPDSSALAILDAGGVIEEGDTLVFMSEIEMLPELMCFHGLVFTSMQEGLAEKDKIRASVPTNEGRLIEAVVGCGSAAVGLRPDAGFREYGGFVVAVHRHGVPLLSHDSVALQAGDALLVLTTDTLLPAFTRDSAFARVRLVTSYTQRRSFAPLLGLLSLVLMIVLSQFLNAPLAGHAALFKTALYGVTATAVTGCAASHVDMRWS